MKPSWINTGREDAVCDIAKVEQKYHASWVGQFPLKDVDGMWTNFCGDVYYQESLPHPGYSHYFALVRRNDGIVITSGQSAVEGVFAGVVAEDGEVIYSRYRHDYRTSKDGTVFVDGGRDYTRASGKLVQLSIEGGKIDILKV